MRRVTVLLRDGREDAEFRVQIHVDSHDGGNVSTTVAIIRRRPDRHDGLFGEVELQRRQ